MNKSKNNLANLRKEKNFTQEDMAKKLGVSLLMYQFYEKSNKEIPISVWMGICNILGLNVADTKVLDFSQWLHHIKFKEGANSMDLQTTTSLTCFINNKKVIETDKITIINSQMTFYDRKGNFIQIHQNQNQLEINLEFVRKE